MGESRLLYTSAGTVEIMYIPGDLPPVLFFPGGHCSAASDCGWGMYSELGHGVLSFSRPGYGGTRVGQLSAAEFAPLTREVCEQLGISVIAASVGVSFGGLQAACVAADRENDVPRLILHSCAPSCLPYPDSRAEALLGPVVFSPLLQALVWRLVRGIVRSDSGLRLMMSNLSTLPVNQWWGLLGADDRTEARALFNSMRSDSGFVNDLRQGRARDVATRRSVIASVQCPTLVTGSPYDGGVDFVHAKDFAETIPDATLIELDSPSHIFWIGPQRAQLVSTINSFINE
ncbi:alpha/beta fold hydrolase [Pseudarthrobacter sp. Y6]|uniref:alpha/beta fold hydrolase n=1 Tax=Pseudarthrobacter sp. Y6 TaxID=3418422 RepID=UPI003CFB7201